jgi:hypothetical protein
LPLSHLFWYSWPESASGHDLIHRLDISHPCGISSQVCFGLMLSGLAFRFFTLQLCSFNALR